MSELSSTGTTDLTAPSSERALPDPKNATGHVASAAVVVEEDEGASFSDIFSAYQRTNDRRSGEEGRQIRGTVVAVNTESVFVDIGFKSEGILPLTAFSANKEPVKPGDTLMVSVKGRDSDGYYGLSLFRVTQPKDWSNLQTAFADGTNIVGTVTAVVKGGLHVDVGVRAFLPASRSGARDAAEMEKLVGQEILCRITKLDVVEEDVVIDRRVVTEEEELKGRDLRFAAMQEGSIVDGTVRSLVDYGAFIDLGGIDGLLHVSDMAWSRIGKPSDVLEVGQELQVKILKIDPESRRISLGLKQLQPHPWDSVAGKFAVGDRVRGTVTRTADFGAFVEIAPGVEGLVHLSEMSWSKRIHKATEVLNVGDTVDALILGIGVEDRRISLGLKQALGDPWVDAAEQIKVGAVVEGPVVTIMKFGAFVQISEGVQGLVHISEITAERRLNHPSDVLRVGEVVRAQVLEIDKEKRQLRLSIKQLVPTSLDEFLGEHKTGDAVTGRVISVESGVARVELGEGITAHCTLPTVTPEAPETPVPQTPVVVDLSAFSSMLKSKWKSGDSPAASTPSTDAKKSEAIKAGQVRSFTIGTIDPTEKSIELILEQ